MAHENSLKLPILMVGLTDVSRLQHEIRLIDEFMSQATTRQPGTPVKMPKTSKMLDQLVEVNELNLLKSDDREKLTGFLKEIYTGSPVMHISFSADPSLTFTQKLLVWLRQEIHPTLLVQIGLQPNIGVGCIVRTDSKVFDLSLRQKFADNKMSLIRSLGEVKS